MGCLLVACALVDACICSRAMLGPCVRVPATTALLFERMMIVFFNIREHGEASLSTMVVADMRQVVYPAAQLVPSTGVMPLFATRAMLISYQAALQAERDMLDALACEALETAKVLYASEHTRHL